MASTLGNEKTSTASQHCLLSEQMHSHFSRFQFFFDPPHIQQLAKSDRRFLQRIYREKSHANVDAFYAINCEEAELPKKFRQLYDAVLKADGSATRAYQLIVNSLTQYYSRLTWATSVQKHVIKFLEDSILSKFQDLGEQLIGQKSLFELELVCLLELFVLRYASNCVNEDTIFELLANIREKGGEEHMSAFVNDHLINHFGFSLEHRLRRIVERLDLKVKAFRGDQPFSSSAGVGRRKLSLHALERASEVRNGGRGGSSGKGNSSEPTHSSMSTDMEEEDGVGEQQPEAKVGTGRRQQQQQHRRNGRHSSSVGGTDGGGEEQKEAEEATEDRSPSPPAKRLRSGSNAFCTTASNKRSLGKPKFLVIDTSEESNGSSSSTSGTTTAAPAATAESSSMATHRIPLTRSVTANAIVSSSSSSSRGRRRVAALSPTKKATTNHKKILSSSVPSGARPSMASIDVRAASLLRPVEVLEQYRNCMNALRTCRIIGGEMRVLREEVASSTMFRKPKRQEHLRKPKAQERHEDEEEEEDLEEVDSRIQDVLEAQKVRQRRFGMDAVECAVGKDLAREFHRLDENPFQMRGGAMLRLSDHQKAALNAADIEADIKEQFKKETLLRDEHEEMRRYVEARIAAECPAAMAAKGGAGANGVGPSDSKRPKIAGPEDDILFKAAELVKQYGSKRNEELLSNQMLVGIPEVDLGIETRMRNIEATEQKKVELLKKGIIPQPTTNWQPVVVVEEIEEG